MTNIKKTTHVLSFILLCFTGVLHAAQFNVLLFTKTDGWHHKAINESVTAFKQMSKKYHFDYQWHEDPSRFNDENLQQFDLIVFLLTTGDVLNEEQQKSMERFIQSGKGFVGIHSASDTEYNWPWYTQLVGRSFIIHPVIQTGKITVLKPDFPGLELMPKKFFWTDEWYEFGKEKAKNLKYLLSVDEKTYTPTADWGTVKGTGMGDFHPIAWYHKFDGGRSFYTALGHIGVSYQDPLFQAHLYGGMYWAATGKGL